MSDLASDLAMVRRHVAEGQRHVLRQREIIDHLRELGGATNTAEDLLAEFEMTLSEHEAHLERLTTSGPY